MTACLCGASAPADEPVGTRDGRTVVRCTACGLVRTLDPPADYVTLYTVGTLYHEGRTGDHYHSNPNYKERFKHDYAVMRERWGRFMQQWRSLDVGSANGAAVSFLNEQGLNAEGLELNPAMAAWSERVTGRKMHTSWDRIFGLFDLITYHDVLEHCPDPLVELRQAAARLHVGSWLIVDTPDTGDPRFAELGMEWHHMKPVEHLWFWNEPTLRALVESVGGLWVRGVDRPVPGKVVLYATRLS